MIHLFFVVMSMILMVSLTFSGIQYLDPDGPLRVTLKADIKNGFDDLEEAYDTYVLTTGSKPDTLTWDTDLTPRFVFMPPTPGETSWSYGSNGVGEWFCLSGTFNETLFEAAGMAGRHYSEQAYFISEACGSRANITPSAFPADVAVTFWVSSPI